MAGLLERSVLLGKKINDMIQLSDIESFYEDQIKELETELQQVGRPPIEMEESRYNVDNNY